MRRIIAHIGDAKCGSTAIQKSLEHHRTELETRHGLLYRTGDWLNHFPLVQLVGHKSSLDDETFATEAQKMAEDIRQSLSIEGINLLSAENFLRLAPVKFHKILETVGFDDYAVDTICYIRAPQDHYLSSVQEKLKISCLFEPPERYRRYLHKTLDNWQKHPKVSSLTVKQFSRDRLIGKDITTDFAHELERLTGSHDIELSTMRANESVSAEQMVVLQWIRQSKLVKVDGKQRPEITEVLKFFGRINGTGLVGNKPRLKPEIREMIRANNAHDFFRVSKLFDVDFGFEDAPPPNPERPLHKEHGPYQPKPVEDILETVDLELVEDLKRLVEKAYRRAGPGGKKIVGLFDTYVLDRLGLAKRFDGNPSVLRSDLMTKYNLDPADFKTAYARYCAGLARFL